MDERLSPHDGQPASGALPDDIADELNRLWTFVRAFGNTAHELNNGLQIIAGQAEMLAMVCTTADAQRRLREIGGAVARSASDLQTLLHYGRLRPAPPQSQDVAGMIRACTQMRAASLARRRIVLGPLALPDPCRATVDRAQFMQLLLDLLLACEDDAAHGRGGTMAVEVETGSDALLIRIRARWQEIVPPPAGEGHVDLGGGALTLAVARRLAERLGGSLGDRAGTGWRNLDLSLPSR